jgi:hypothetical protein
MRTLIVFFTVGLLSAVAVGIPLDLMVGRQGSLAAILIGVAVGTMVAIFITHRLTGEWIMALGSTGSRPSGSKRRLASKRGRDARHHHDQPGASERRL